MNCPVCTKPIKKISWRVTSNHKTGADLQEYDKTTYYCAADDAYLETEIPTTKQ